MSIRHFVFVAFAALATPALAGPTNVAPLGTASQSSTAYDSPQFNGSGPASRANDGDTNGQYAHGSVSHTQSEQGWWQVKLDKAYVLDGATIWNRTDCCTARVNPFTVDVYLGDTLVSSVKHNAMPDTNSLKINLKAAVGDRVHVAMERPDYLHLAEVQVFGEPVRDVSGEYTYLGNGVATVKQNGADIRILCTWTPIANGPHYEIKGKFVGDAVAGDTIVGEWYSRYAKKGWFRFVAKVSPNGNIDFSQSDDTINAGMKKVVLTKKQ